MIKNDLEVGANYVVRYTMKLYKRMFIYSEIMYFLMDPRFSEHLMTYAGLYAITYNIKQRLIAQVQWSNRRH